MVVLVVLFFLAGLGSTLALDSDGLAVLCFSLAVVCLMVVVIVTSTSDGLTKAVKNGPLVDGTVVSVRDTGARVNNDMRVELTVELTTLEGKKVTATTKKLVSVLDVPKIQPGASLPIRYDPADPTQCAVDEESHNQYRHVSETEHGLDQKLVAAGKMTQEMADRKENGVRAEGVILRSAPTGRSVDGSDEYELWIRVTRPDGSTYETTKLGPVPRGRARSVEVGRVVSVFYMPDDEQKISLTASLLSRRRPTGQDPAAAQ